MKPKTRKKSPELILRDGKPAAVILDISVYQEILERLEDVQDLKALAKMRQRPLKFKTLEDFIIILESAGKLPCRGFRGVP